MFLHSNISFNFDNYILMLYCYNDDKTLLIREIVFIIKTVKLIL